MYYNDKVFYEVIEWLIGEGVKVTFETNGTIEIDFEKFPIYKNITFAMSVKLENSGELKSKRINHEAIKVIVANTKESFFKFVLSKKDIKTKEIKEITKPYPNIKIYCMPMGSTAKELAQNDKAVANFCIKNGYNYVDRMHIRLWDNEEGR